jgi:hypothetical protein
MTDIRNNPGIASMGELLFIRGLDEIPSDVTSKTQPWDIQDTPYYEGMSADGALAGYPSVYPMHEELSGYDPAGGDLDPDRLNPDESQVLPETVSYRDGDDIPLGRVQRLARFHNLANTYTTRSDIYAAYMVFRAVPAADFTETIESQRAIVIFDRSQVVQKDNSVRILSVWVLE